MDPFVEQVNTEIAILQKEADHHEISRGMGGHFHTKDTDRLNKIAGLILALKIYYNTRD